MNKLFLWIAAASAFVLQSCENTDGIRDEIGSLRDRVIALEAKIGSVNTSIVALHKLMDESTIIVGIEPNAKGYEIELSDGTRLPVILGEKIEALVPVMGIDAEGYWTVSLDGGATSERLKVGGEYVSAWPVSGGDHKPGAEGVTPQLKVSADGEWLVSLDGGATYAPLLQNEASSTRASASSSERYCSRCRYSACFICCVSWAISPAVSFRICATCAWISLYNSS